MNNSTPPKTVSAQKAQNENEPPVPSPCVSICALDDDDICIGCHRSGDEISQWGSSDNEWKRAVLKKADARWRGQL